MADPVNLQYQVRQNSEELQDFLKDLYKWEEDVQSKDKILANSTSLLDSLHPVRNKPKKKKSKSKPQDRSSQSKPKLKGHDFQAWDKYDVDQALKEIDEKEEMQTQSTSDEDEDTDDEVVEQRRLQQALFEKDKGNDLFKEGKYEAAINRYTTAIALDPYNAILPANRAMALIKVQRYGAAIQDCDTALGLDNTYIKAFARRASAKHALGKLKEAMKDYERVRELQPGNKQALEGIEKIKKLLTAKSKEPTLDMEIQKDKIKCTYAVKKPMKRYSIEEIGTASSDEEEVCEKNDGLRTATKTKADLDQRSESTNVHTVETVKESDPKPIKTIAENTEYLRTNEVQNRSNRPAVEGSALPSSCTKNSANNGSLNYDLTPPVSSIQFETTWKRLEKNPDLLYKYMKGIPPERLPKVIGESVESTLLIKILSVIREFYLRDHLPIFTELKYISQVKRFSMTLMFLSVEEKTVIKDLFDYLNKFPIDERMYTKEDLQSLKLKYGIR